MSAVPSIREGLARGHHLGLRYRLALPQASMLGRSGSRLGHGIGSSLDFHDYRDYHPGDDLRHLDWSVYARSDREVIKQFRAEVAPHLDLVLDISRSMALPESPKALATATLAALCATAASQARCSRAIWLAGERLERLPDTQQLPQSWPPFDFDDNSPPATALLRLTPAWRRHGLRIFLSDLLWPADPLPLLRRLAEGAASLAVVQLLAAIEEQPRPCGPTRLEEVEGGATAELLLDSNACAAYERALRDHRDDWAAACRSVGATFVTLTAESVMAQERQPLLESCGLLEIA